MSLRDLGFLVVDDSATVRGVVVKVLETTLGSKNIYQAKDGSEAVEMLKSKKVDFIISDWNMPKMKGDELLFEVRSNPQWKDIPFIIMTTHAEKDFVITAIQLGASQYVVKPFTPAELEDKIRKSWNSANKREAQRYSALPKHRLTLSRSEDMITAEIINLSRTGMLVRLPYSESVMLFCDYEICLEFEKCNGLNFQRIHPLHGLSVRLEAESPLNPVGHMCQMALFLPPQSMAKPVEERLNAFLNYLNTLGVDIVPAE